MREWEQNAINHNSNLEAERDRLKSHIEFYQVNTPSREKKVKRIIEIERELKTNV